METDTIMSWQGPSYAGSQEAFSAASVPSDGASYTVPYYHASAFSTVPVYSWPPANEVSDLEDQIAPPAPAWDDVGDDPDKSLRRVALPNPTVNPRDTMHAPHYHTFVPSSAYPGQFSPPQHVDPTATVSEAITQPTTPEVLSSDQPSPTPSTGSDVEGASPHRVRARTGGPSRRARQAARPATVPTSPSERRRHRSNRSREIYVPHGELCPDAPLSCSCCQGDKVALVQAFLSVSHLCNTRSKWDHSFCPSCHRECGSVNEAFEHYQRVHIGYSNALGTTADERSPYLRCPYCPYQQLENCRRSNLVSHMLRHFATSFPCKHCTVSYNQQSSLDKHTRTAHSVLVVTESGSDSDTSSMESSE